MNRKTSLFFGPPLARLVPAGSNTLETSGRVNCAVERYLEILRHHGLALDDVERECLARLCGVGRLVPEEIRGLADEVRYCGGEFPGLDKEMLAAKLAAASFADLVATVEALGF